MRTAYLQVTLLSLALAASSRAFAATGFYKGEKISGLNKVCFYDVLGSPYTVNVGAAQLCPQSIEAPNPAPSPNRPALPQLGRQTGFLTGERTSGMNKVCFYNVVGSTKTLTVSAVSLCPLNYQF